MLYIPLPRRRYNLGDYPGLEVSDNRVTGAPIPIGIGDIHNAKPTCIDTAGQVYKLTDHDVHAFDAVRDGSTVLTLGTDYTVDLALGEITLVATPRVVAATTYYLLFESDFAIDGVNFLSFEENQGHYHPKSGPEFDGERLWHIDGAGVWVDSLRGLYFDVYGRTSLDAAEEYLVNRYDKTAAALVKTGHWDQLAFLRDTADRTKIAQEFTTPAAGGPWYLTRIRVSIKAEGAPAATRITQISILTAAKVQTGAKSIRYEDLSGGGNFPLRSEVSDLNVDFRGKPKGGVPIDTLADSLEYLVVTELGKSAALLDPVYLAALAAARTQTLKIHADKMTTFGEIVGKLEGGQLWKLVPLLDGTYAPVLYGPGEPANTPHFQELYDSEGKVIYSDFIKGSFQMWRDFGAVRRTVHIRYDEDAGSGEFKVETVESDLARFVYLNEEEWELETFHASTAGAAWLGGEVSKMYEEPPLYVKFEVHGTGLELLPARDKFKLTLGRAMYPGGSMSGVLFRIFGLKKKPATSTTEFFGQLDTQTY